MRRALALLMLAVVAVMPAAAAVRHLAVTSSPTL